MTALTKNHGSAKERITHFFPTAREFLRLRYEANLILFYINLQQPMQLEETEMYLHPNCPLRCGSGVSTILYCQNCNALNLVLTCLIGLNCETRE